MLSVFLQTVLAKVAESLSGDEVNIYGLVYEVLEAELGPEGAEAIFTIFGELQNGSPRNNCDSERIDGGRLLDIHTMEHNQDQKHALEVPKGGEIERLRADNGTVREGGREDLSDQGHDLDDLVQDRYDQDPEFRGPPRVYAKGTLRDPRMPPRRYRD